MKSHDSVNAKPTIFISGNDFFSKKITVILKNQISHCIKIKINICGEGSGT